jgi:hypothetical protein
MNEAVRLARAFDKADDGHMKMSHALLIARALIAAVGDVQAADLTVAEHRRTTVAAIARAERAEAALALAEFTIKAGTETFAKDAATAERARVVEEIAAWCDSSALENRVARGVHGSNYIWATLRNTAAHIRATWGQAASRVAEGES